ncbi:molybdenum cofactor guanylyltransferase MobA [Imbroritus primus]|uniref:Molybdenum cofactor guanylyltransferase MobA n=1 Tax=Imbroritus primus TaxID=3058603 RepID=A0ACD3SQ45_9BURK|nr:molybdenum cofactor guanylyltransferase MobA [Burkholderiaceae bacterium PBA]
MDRQDVTGLILAGGRGSRMGGVDKGLQPFRGTPLAMHTLLRLAPQTGHLLVNANRNLAAYESFGVPVVTDAVKDFPGPLAGMLAGLQQCETPYMVTAPCDSPLLPTDLVARLGAALLEQDAEIAMALTQEPDGHTQRHPVFMLMQVTVLPSLAQFLAEGERKIAAWTDRHRTARVLFDDANAFSNINTLDELRALEQPVAASSRNIAS